MMLSDMRFLAADGYNVAHENTEVVASNGNGQLLLSILSFSSSIIVLWLHASMSRHSGY